MGLLRNSHAADEAKESSRPVGLRILAFCDYFAPEMGGGAERVAYEVYRRLASEGAEITVVTTATSGGEWPDRQPKLQVVRVPTLDLRKVLRIQSSMTWGATSFAVRLAERIHPHLLHANSLEFQTSLAAARLARTSGLPLVLTAHIGGFADLPKPWRSVGGLYEGTVGRYLLSRSRLVIAVSDAVADHLRRWPQLEKRVRVVPNGVDHQVFHPLNGSGLDSEVRLLFLGRLIKNKGPHLLIEAFRLLRREGRPVRLACVGDGPMRLTLQRSVDQDPLLRDHVTFTGYTNDVATHLRETDVLVRPSLTEGMSLAVLEAMASGVCVVASAVAGNRSLIRDGETGFLFRPGDARSLTDVLRRAVGDSEERLRIAAAGHRLSRDYSWDRCTQETLDVFLEALRRPVRGVVV